jgi:serine phosphatase RsbU (regulator of sigma subunit)
MGADKTQFGFDRALGVIKRNRRSGARRVVEQLYQAVRFFSGDRPQEDDITSVICKVNAIG